MSIYFYNTPDRKKEQFTPIHEGKVALYTCGPTVYNTPHIGNWVSYVRWDILVRTLTLSGYDVERVMNITDVGHLTSDADEGEDKMQKGARREGVTAWDVAKRYTDEFLQGMQALNMITPTHLTKATEHIETQLNLVRTLKEKGYTYQIDDGIYFDTAKFPDYAKFARLDLDELKAGARVEANSQKRNPSDFALWKFSPTDTKRDMEWETPEDLLDTENTAQTKRVDSTDAVQESIEEPQRSVPEVHEASTADADAAMRDDIVPRKMGFPGWHLECSAMAMQYLGKTIDIHTGGIDHIPVHHTNEIAQSTAATGQPFAHFWLHNAHLLSDSRKISKSLNNGYTLEQIAQHGFAPLDFKMFVLQSHYRTESNFTWDNLKAAKARVQHWRNVANLRWQIKDTQADNSGAEEQNVAILTTLQNALEVLQDDLDTPAALKVIDELFSKLESSLVTDTEEASFMKLLRFIDAALGLDLVAASQDISDEQKEHIVAREQARTAKDWAKADELRTTLEADGIGVRDTAHGSVWFKL